MKLKNYILFIISFLCLSLSLLFAAASDEDDSVGGNVSQSDVNVLLGNIRDTNRDIKDRVSQFDRAYNRAYNMMQKSKSLYDSYSGSVSSAKDRFTDSLRDYKPGSSSWDSRSIMRMHKVDMKSVDDLNNFESYAEGVSSDLQGQADQMTSLADKIEADYRAPVQSESDVKVYRTYYYDNSPYYYGTRYYYTPGFTFGFGHGYRRHPGFFRHHGSGGYFGIHF